MVRYEFLLSMVGNWWDNVRYSSPTSQFKARKAAHGTSQALQLPETPETWQRQEAGILQGHLSCSGRKSRKVFLTLILVSAVNFWDQTWGPHGIPIYDPFHGEAWSTTWRLQQLKTALENNGREST